jgi:hypothetical protein
MEGRVCFHFVWRPEQAAPLRGPELRAAGTPSHQQTRQGPGLGALHLGSDLSSSPRSGGGGPPHEGCQGTQFAEFSECSFCYTGQNCPSNLEGLGYLSASELALCLHLLSLTALPLCLGPLLPFLLPGGHPGAVTAVIPVCAPARLVAPASHPPSSTCPAEHLLEARATILGALGACRGQGERFW